jgi:hypothetical protein
MQALKHALLAHTSMGRALCSRSENFDSLRRPDDGTAVEIGNPATAEFEVRL